ncbi:MAG: response regulator, partial [Cytophagaceae bacterium]
YKGYKAEEIIGQHFSRFYPEEAIKRGFPDEELRMATKDGRFEDEGWRLRRDGSRFWANVIITALCDSNGNLRGFAKLTRDLTERKQAEEELRQARDTLEERVAERTATLIKVNEELQTAKVAADEANDAKSEFLSRMSHELRTPLNAILGYAQLLEMSDLAPQDQEDLERIVKSGHHLLSLINEVLDIARIEAGRMDLSIEPVCVAGVLSEAVELVQALATNNHIRLQTDRVLASNCHVLADHQRLKQVLINLLSNAVKYNRVHGEIEVTCTTHQDRVRISIRDTGYGITPANLPKLFSPFERLDSTQTTIEGTGLGLTFSKHMVEAMGGLLGVQSVVGEGSTFYTELPYAEGSIKQVPRQVKPFRDEVKLPKRTHKVLLIEDNVSNYQLIKRILSSRPNIELSGAMQGRIGLEMAKYNRPDLVLLDVHLPDMLGSEVLRLLRESAETADIPVIIVSADATPQQIQRLMAAGASAYLTKPVEIKEILALIDKTLDRGE